MKKLFAGLTVLFLGFRLFAGVMEVPRKVFVINTQYFDILFSKESTGTAKKLAVFADEYYLEAKKAFNNQYDFKTLVVISPDSQILSVKYTPSPYNRIVVYEGEKSLSDESYINLLNLFRYEVVKAVSQSVRSEFWEKTSRFIGGDSLQPVALMNMPFSFLEGAVNSEFQKDDYGLLADNWNLQILSQMKLEGNIPSILQLSGALDIYPGERFTKLGASAFCAYLQQRFGIEKFVEFWEECGKIHLFRINKGIFDIIYGFSLEEIWQDFIDSIPVPEIQKDSSALFFDYDNDSVYKFLIYTPYGFVWYNELKKEVDIFDNYSLTNFGQLLFLASEVTSLSASPDGRYLIVTFVQGGTRENFKKKITQIYDLKKREFLKENIFQKQFDFMNSFDSSIGVYNPVILGENKSAALFCQFNQWYLGLFDSDSGENLFYQIKFQGEILKIRNLRLVTLKEKEALFFDFILEQQASFSRAGYVLLDENFYPEEVFVLNEDYSGGINDGILAGENFYYFAHKFHYDEFRFVAVNQLHYEQAEICVPNIIFPDKFQVRKPEIVQQEGKNYLDNFQLAKYNPWGLMFHGNWIPFMPVKNISLQNDVELSPGLGVTFETQSDPFSDNLIILSAGAFYLPMEFTKYFNATEESKKQMAAKQMEFDKDIGFAVYAENTSMPIDLSIGSIYRFNTDGEYTFKGIGGIKYQVPFRMDFRRMTLDIKGLYTASTSYWDSFQRDFYPDLSNWPSFENSYRSWQAALNFEYTNIHQWGISPFKKMGIDFGMQLTSTWDLNLMELQWKGSKLVGNNSVENQKWKWKYSPTQIIAGFNSTVEIPYLLPLHNINGWILSEPVTIYGELFYRNGVALDVNTRILLFGKEFQKGINKLDIYFPRFGLYAGYDVSMDYDTNVVVLPDLRDVTRFYEVFTNCYLNDSFFVNFEFHTTPVVGKFSVDKLISAFTFQYYIRTKEFKLSCNFKLDIGR